MAKDGHHFITFANFGPTHVVIYVLGTEAHVFADFQHISKALGRAFTKRHSRFSFFLDAADLDCFRQGLEQRLFLTSNGFFEFHRDSSSICPFQNDRAEKKQQAEGCIPIRQQASKKGSSFPS